jgi:tetratricopeptide (TPR) repeat protein
LKKHLIATRGVTLLTVMRVYFAVMKRLLSLLVLTVLTLNVAAAQEAVRVVVLPFSAIGNAAPYQVGLATALQRSLNVIDGLYAPPVGDTLIVTQRLESRGELSAARVASAFGASAVVSGRVTPVGGEAEVLLGFAGPAFPDIRDVTVRGPLGNPAELTSLVLEAVVRELGLQPSSSDRSQWQQVVAQTPSLPSLNAVGEVSLRLPQASFEALAAALEIDGSSSWVLSELARARALAGEREEALELSQRAIDAAPADIEALVVRGNILNVATAQQAFEAALAINSFHALALLGRGNAASDTAALEAAAQSYPRLVDAYLDLAALQSGARALQTLRRGAEQVPDSIALRRAVMQQALAAGDAAGALAYLQQELANDEARSPALYALAQLLPPQFEAQALELLRAGRERYPQSTVLAVAYAEALQQAGDASGAEAVLRDALERSPDNLELRNRLAIMQAQQGDFDAARATLEEVAAQSDALQVNLAQIYLQAGQSRAALELLEPLAQQNPNDAELQALYGVALGRTGNLSQAQGALERALELDPTQEMALAARRALEQQQQLTRGEPIEALNAEASIAFEAGLAALERGEFAEAAQAFARALEAQDSGIVAFYRGYALQRQGQSRQSLSFYDRALQDFPESDVILNNIGFAQLQLGRYDLALDALNRALAANAQNPEVHLNLGFTYYALQRYAQATQAFEEAVRLRPGLQDDIGQLLETARSRAGR